MGRARTDQNNIFSLIAVSNADGVTPIELWADPNTHQLLTSGSGGGGGGDGAILDGVNATIKGTVFDLANSNPIATQIVDATGTAITSFGGGTQYADGAVRGTATGTLSMIDDGTNIQSMKGDTDGTAQANMTKLVGTAIDVNGGNKSAGTQRITIADDQTWGKVSTANSSAANLAGAGVFTGTSEDVTNYAAIQVSVFSSHASATDGLSLQQSSDGTNWDVTDTYSISATTSKLISVQPAARFFRLVYTNGATLTTSLRIQTVFHTIAPNPSSQRAADAYTNETDLTQLWAFNSLFNGTTWDRVRSVVNATNTTGTGIQATGILAQLDDTSPTAITENQFGNLRMAADRSQLVSRRSVTPTTTTVGGSATSVSLLAANNSRKLASIFNDSTAVLYIKYGATASTTSFYDLLYPNDRHVVEEGYVGAIDGIWGSATGNARITEVI